MSKESSSSKKKFNNKVLIWVIAILIINVIAYQFYFQLDLTHDQRYTLHDKTKSMLKDMKSPVVATVFLTGDELPADFKRLANSTENILRTFRDVSGYKVDYAFVDPTQLDSVGIRKMNELGIYSIPVTVSKGKKGTKQIPVSPFVLIESDQGGIPVALQSLGSQRLTAADINQSEILLEYNIANAIRKVNKEHVDTILYLVGNEQSSGHEVYRLATQISMDYMFVVDTLQTIQTIPQSYKAVIVNKPRKAFSETDKFKLDQYLMNGGQLLFNLDMTTASFDSFKVSSSFTAIPIDLNLNDLFFTYGVRVNNDIVSDLDKNVDIPLQNIDVQNAENNMLPFRYFPIAEPGSEHPIVKNLNEVLIKYASSIDLVNDQLGLKKTTLLQTSKYGRTESVPKIFDLSQLYIEPMRSQFDKPHVILSVLIEGKFKSLYEQRVPQEIAEYAHDLKTESPDDSKVIIFSDGDIFENESSDKYGPMEMGAYLYSPYVFNNSSLMMNTMEYLIDDNHLLDARSKYYEPSILDRKRIIDEATIWQLINIGIPVLIVVVFGLIFTFIRKNIYAK